MVFLKCIGALAEFIGLSWINYPINQMADGVTYLLDGILLLATVSLIVKFANRKARVEMVSSPMESVQMESVQMVQRRPMASPRRSPQTPRQPLRRSQRLANKRKQ